MALRSSLLCFLLLQLSASARADGTMSIGGRELFREGVPEPRFCSAGAAQDECDRAKTKVLSGYGYLRGRVVGGVATDARRGGTSGAAGLRVDVASGSLPGGDIALGSVEGWIDSAALRRLRVTLLETDGLFFCRDTQSGKYVAPFVGMVTHHCANDAVVALDAGLIATQWDASSHHFAVEWLHAGPALELLGNGLGYAHLLRSVMIGAPLDLRSMEQNRVPGSDRISLGLAPRVAAFYRTPHWEARLDVHYRTALAGGAGFRHDNTLQAELRLLHNFFLIDALVLQAGLSLRAMWTQQPDSSFVVWAAPDRRWLGFFGLYLGWISEPPNL